MKCKKWTPEMEETMRREYADSDTAALAERFGATVNATYHKARSLGLRKSRQYKAEIGLKACANLGVFQKGFQPGHKTWNAGMKGLQLGNPENLFKPGNRPWHARAVGSRRIDDEGYHLIKVAEPNHWRREHKVIWEHAHGPIPKGSVTVFRDGNKNNLDLENLELVSRAELMRRNSFHRFPPELKEAIRLNGKIKRLINEKRDDGLTEPSVHVDGGPDRSEPAGRFGEDQGGGGCGAGDHQ